MLTCLLMTIPFKKCLDNYEAFKVINDNLLKLSIYGSQWLISFNALKTECIILSKRKTCGRHPDLFLNDSKITEANHHKHLGLIISNTMPLSYHINEILLNQKKYSQLCEGQNISFQEVVLISYIKA